MKRKRLQRAITLFVMMAMLVTGTLPNVVAAEPNVEATSENEVGTVGAELIAVTNEPVYADKSSIYPALELDEAYVQNLEIYDTVTGTETFDENDEPGNDSSVDNDIVRSFDTINYGVKVTMDVYNNQKYGEARVRLQFVLPLSKEEAEFDTAAMGWMDTSTAERVNADGTTTTVDYNWTITEENRDFDGDGTEEKCQVLSCYRHLIPADQRGTVLPGYCTVNVAVKVKEMTNGSKVNMQASASMEHCANDAFNDGSAPMTWEEWDGICRSHQTVKEKLTVNAEEVTVSAAPKYNVQIRLAGNSQISSTYDFTTGNEKALNKNAALATDGTVEGRIVTYGITLQLYNTEGKGMKGIELPKGDITFDLELNSTFTAEKYNSTTKQLFAVSDTYTPLVWCLDANTQSTSKQDGRDISITSYNIAFGAAPLNSGGNRDYSCYNGGSWSATQEDNIVHVTVSGYEFDGNYPCVNAIADPSNATYYSPSTGLENIGCFSAGEIFIIQPFENLETGKHILDYCETDKGFSDCHSGTFKLEISDKNLQAASVSGQKLATVADNSNQTNTGDDKHGATVYLMRDGDYQNRNLYSQRPAMCDIFGVDEMKAGNCTENGNDWAVLGTRFALTFGGYAKTQGDDANKMCAGKWLLKFDPEAIELQNETAAGGFELNNMYEYRFLYAVKTDGTRWKNNDELLKTTMFELCYYGTIEEAQKHGEIVGILVEAEAKGKDVTKIPAGVVTTYFSQYAKVKMDESLVGRVFAITEESRIWNKNAYENANNTIPTLEGYNPATPIELPASSYDAASNSPSTYVPEEYNENGTVKNNHQGGYIKGDSLLVVGYQSSISKSLTQKVGGTTKETYDLDAGQRYVDFTLQPKVAYNIPNYTPQAAKQTTTVIVVDTLPKYMSYYPGSAYLGGTYTQTSTNGGTPGTVTGGKEYTPTVSVNEDGATTLTWTIADAEIGKALDPIYFTAVIGDKKDPDADVPIGTTSLKNTVTITATEDHRVHTAANGNLATCGFSAVRNQASAFGKYAVEQVVDPDGIAEYVVYYGNNTTSSADVYMVDAMPYNEDPRGSRFDGTYNVKSWKVTSSNGNTLDGISLYYTVDEAYKDATTNSDVSTYVEETTVKTKWTKAAIGADGTCTYTENETPTAWAIIGTVAEGDRIEVDLQLKLEPGENNSNSNSFINVVSWEKLSSRDKVTTVSRHLSGLAWLDTDQDGVRESGESTLEGIQVKLFEQKNIAWYFDEANNTEGWTKGPNLKSLNAVRGYLYGEPVDGKADLYFDVSGLSYEAAEYGKITIAAKYVAAMDNSDAQVFFKRAGGNGYNEPDSVKARFNTAGKSYGDIVTCTFDMTGNTNYDGTITNLRIDPFSAEVAFQIDYIIVEATGDDAYEVKQTKTTDANGFYQFDGLGAGVYAVKFTNDGERKISPYRATSVNVGNYITDSDGVPTYSNDSLESTLISGIVMPTVKKLNWDGVTSYYGLYNDSGFYDDIKLNPDAVVIDFGLPVDITQMKNDTLPETATAEFVGIGSTGGEAAEDLAGLPDGYVVTEEETLTLEHGTASKNGDKCRYTPTDMEMSDSEVFTYAVQLNDGSDSRYYYSTVTVIPATNVYYEDSFLTFTNAKDADGNVIQPDEDVDKNAIQYGVWETDGTTTANAIQQEDRPGTDQVLEDVDANNVYGYDEAYDECNMFSLGSAKKVTVNSDTGKKSAAPTASFTFTGTAFDVISITDNQSGAINVTVYKEDGTKVLSYIVDDYYGYKYENGEWIVDESSSDCLYQVPVIKVEGLDYATYNVEIKAAYLDSMNHTGEDHYTIWLDAIRTYNPAENDSTAEDAYVKDGESNPQLITLKDILVDAGTFNSANADIVGAGFVNAVFIDGIDAVESADIATYDNQGPNNETYLKKGQAIAFQLMTTTNPDNITSIQIGAKLANGGTATLMQNTNEVAALTTATNMFYKLTGITWTKAEDANRWTSSAIVLSNKVEGEDDVLSLTDLKITGTEEFTIFKDAGTATSEIDGNTVGVGPVVCAEAQAVAVDVMQALYPVPAFEPGTFEAKWKGNTAGSASTLTVTTSEDVEKITVNGDEITEYKESVKYTGSFWNRQKVKQRVWTYKVTQSESGTYDYEIVAYDASGVGSEALEAPLTVKKSKLWGWFGGLFK